MATKYLHYIPRTWHNLCLGCSKSINRSLISKKFLSTTCVQHQNSIPSTEQVNDQSETLPLKPQLPLLTSRKLEFPPKIASKQAWLETLGQIEDEKLGIVDLHPEIFGVFPRIDILWWNIFWQQHFRKIRYTKANTRAEMRGGGRKPWPQKGTGRARHGSIRSPLWHKGGKAHGPRGPLSYFFMLPDSVRVLGLRTALTVKYAQNNLHVVDSLDIPDDDPKYLENVIESKGWGLSVLFIDDSDVIPRNIALATDDIKQYNVMPVYGLNVYSILKHETLVLTLDALNTIEHKLLQHMHSQDFRDKAFTSKSIHP